MKKIRYLLTAALALITICCFSIGVFANETPANVSSEPSQSIQMQITDTTPDAPYGEESDAEIASADDAQSSIQKSDEALQQENIMSEKKNTNAPYFAGAVIAVIVFIGVALYCKYSGGGRIK